MLELDGKPPNRVGGGSPEELARHLADSGENAWYYNENLRISFVKLFDSEKKYVMRVQA